MNDRDRYPQKVLGLGQKSYPPLLKEIPEPPKILYLKGNFIDWARPAVAIVGTRKATRYGLEAAKTIARDLAENGIIIVSGLALGIDAEAHKGALEGNGVTLAVLGSGINQVYPATNRVLAEKIMAGGGALVSEFEPDFPPEKWTFPQRNRIIAGLSQMTLVVEAPEKSGALITAFFALEFNREVGAVPGEIFSINACGVNKLIKMGARTVTSADDIMETLGVAKPAPVLDKTDKSEQIILQCLDEPADRDRLGEMTALAPHELNQKLTLMELRGIIKNYGGKFQKI